MGKDNVIFLNNETSLDIPADRVLEAAVGELDSAVVIGYDKDGNLYTASSLADGGDVLWLLELCKNRLMKCNLSDED